MPANPKKIIIDTDPGIGELFRDYLYLKGLAFFVGLARAAFIKFLCLLPNWNVMFDPSEPWSETFFHE